MERRDCWEIKTCGREPGGGNVVELGVCPAALPNQYSGVNGGRHAGRFCWAVAGTLCGGKAQGTYAMKLLNCLDCEFLKQVHEDEGREFVLTPRKAERAS
jgi:hypothetical protein